MSASLKLGGDWGVKEGSLLGFNDQNGNYKPIPFDFTRATTATRVNRDGLIEEVQEGVPRIDFLDNPDGALLLEPQRTNNIPYSEYNPSGINLGANLTFNGYVQSPEGVNNGARFTSIAPSASFLQIPNVTIPSGTFTFSMWVRGVSGTFVNRNMYIPSHTGTQPAMNEAPVAGEDWKLVYGSGTNTSGSSYVRTITLPFYDQPASSVFEVYGFQLEEGSYHTSIIKTSGSAVTRNADVCSATGVSSFIGVNQGTIFLDFDVNGVNSGIGNYLFDLSDGTNFDSNRISMYWLDNNTLAIFYGYGGTFSSVAYTSNYLTTKKIAVRWTSSEIQVIIDGEAKTAITYGNSSPTKLNLGSRYNDVELLDVNIKECILFNTTQSEADCISLTN